MGFLDRMFSKNKHARGDPSEDDTDQSSHTRLIPRPDSRAVGEIDPWGGQEEDAPIGGYRADSSDAPTELRPPIETEMPPAPFPPRPHDFGRRSPSYTPAGSGDDETILGETIGASQPGRVLGVLVVIDGSVEGCVLRILEGKNVLGREGHPDPIPKRDETRGISRHHARVEAEAGGFVLEPASERNAVFVNDQLVDQRTLLNHGDRIRLGLKQPLTFVLLVVPPK